MRYQIFLESVGRKADITSREELERAIFGTLEVLGERLTAGEADDLAAQLPSEIGHHLIRRSPSERFGIEEFFRRIGERIGAHSDAAERVAGSVIAVMADTISADEIDAVLSQLPEEFHYLFTQVKEGRLAQKVSKTSA